MTVGFRWLVVMASGGVSRAHAVLDIQGICCVFVLLQLIAVKIIGKRCEAEAEK